MTKRKTISSAQRALPFRTKGGIFAQAHPAERFIAVGVGSLFITLSVLYIFFMFSSVMHVAARHDLAGRMSQLSADVAMLETVYLNKTQVITESYAHSLGYVQTKNHAFAKKISTVSLQTR